MIIEIKPEFHHFFIFVDDCRYNVAFFSYDAARCSEDYRVLSTLVESINLKTK